jgi:hypothetical protein
MSNKEYFESLQTFYEDRLRSQLKDKFKTCANCKENKQFIDEPGKLIYSCGSKSGTCGKQITIHLTRYLHYPEMKSNTTKFLSQSLDKSKFKDIFTHKEINEYKESIQDHEKRLKKSHKRYSEQNNLKERENLIKKTHRNRNNLKKEQNLLLTKIHKEDDIAKKQNFMKEYLQLNQRLKEEYEELLESDTILNQFLVEEEGSVTKHETTHKDKVTKQPKAKKEDKKAKKEDKKEDKPKVDKPKVDKEEDKPKVDKNLIQPLQKLVKQPMNTNTLNIIVAYRNTKDNARKKQLQTFKQQMELIFKDQTNYHIYVIEQESDRTDYDKLPDPIKQEGSTMAKFNLGRLKNIGFELAVKDNKGTKNSYYVLSDVDLLPSVGLVKGYLKYPKIPIHLGNKGTRYNKDGKDKDFLGGVLSVSKQDFEKANGYPNNFWGWGGEDEALNKRFKSAYIKIEKPNDPVIDLETYSIKEKMAVLKKDKMKEMQKWEKLDEDKSSWRTNGLSDIDELYKVVKKSEKSNITHYKVFLHVKNEEEEKEEEEKEEEEEEDSDSSGFNPDSDE